jgi:uncharacterized membrane protein YhaH (DUF805 family)
MTGERNPFAPPEAVVADIAPREGEAFQPVRVLGARGRMGRLCYAVYLIWGSWVAYVAAFVAGVLLDTAMSAFIAGATASAWSIGALAVAALYAIFVVRLGMQRSHDLDLSGWFTLLTLIPLVNLYWLFAPGGKTSNRYGPPPRPNGPGVKILGVVAAFLAAVAFIAVAFN